MAGAGVGLLYGALLWRTVAWLLPPPNRRAIVAVCGGALLRCFVVAMFFLWAARRGLGLVLLALAGFWLARLAWRLAVVSDLTRDHSLAQGRGER